MSESPTALPERKNDLPQWLFVFAVFLIAFINRWSYYLDNPHIFSSGFGMGSDFQVYFYSSIAFAKTLYPHFFYVGSAGLIVPLLGLLLKIFQIYPGIFYFCIIEITISSFVCVVPFFIIKIVTKKISIGGLLAGLYLAFNPLIIKVTPQLGTDTLGLFVLAMTLMFLYRVLYCRESYDYVFFGIFGFLMLITRHVLIAIEIAVILIYIVAKLKNISYGFKSNEFRQKKTKEILVVLMPLIVIVILIISYDYMYVKRHFGKSIILYNAETFLPIFKSNIDIAREDIYHAICNIAKQKYINVQKVNEIIFTNILYDRNLLTWIFLILLTLYTSLTVFCRKFIYFYPVLILGAVYYSILCLTYVVPRYLLPFILIITTGIAFLAEIAISIIYIIFKRQVIKVDKCFRLCIVIIILICFCFSGRVLYVSAINYFAYENYLKWAGEAAPDNSIIITEAEANPWLICKYTKKPVMHNVVYGESFFVNKVPWGLNDFVITSTMFKDKGIEGTDKAVNLFINDGISFVILDTKFIDDLKNNYLKDQSGFTLKEKYQVVFYRKRITNSKFKSIYLLMKDNNENI